MRPKNLNRTAALKAGDVVYVGSPCKKCNEVFRYTKSGNCMECEANRARNRKKALSV